MTKLLLSLLVVLLMAAPALGSTSTPESVVHVHADDAGDAYDAYEAEDDDTPQQIAENFAVDVNDLLALNRDRYEGLAASTPLMEGTLLLLPKDYESQLLRRTGNATNASSSTPAGGATCTGTCGGAALVKMTQTLYWGTSTLSCSDFSGARKLMYEDAYASMVSIWDIGRDDFTTGASVTASCETLGNTAVTFVSLVPSGKLSNVQTYTLSSYVLGSYGFSSSAATLKTADVRGRYTGVTAASVVNPLTVGTATQQDCANSGVTCAVRTSTSGASKATVTLTVMATVVAGMFASMQY